MPNIYIFCGDNFNELDKDNKHTLSIDVDDFELIYHAIVNKYNVFIISDMMANMFPIYNSKITSDFDKIKYYHDYLIDFNVHIDDICDPFLFEIFSILKLSLERKQPIVFMGGLS